MGIEPMSIESKSTVLTTVLYSACYKHLVVCFLDRATYLLKQGLKFSQVW